MTDITDVSDKHERRTVYIVAAFVVLVLGVIAVVSFSSAQATQAAEAKADQLISALQQAGATSPPSQDQIVRVLGNDGGATCVDPGSALTKAALLGLMANGAAGPGERPVLADRRVVLGQLLIIQTYCPDELPGFQRLVNALKFAPVATGAT